MSTAKLHASVAIVALLMATSCKKEKNNARSVETTPPVKASVVKKKIQVDTAFIMVEIADDDYKRQMGLMFRDSLEANSGMLFIFPEPKKQSFWMKNCRFPIDIAYIDASRKITDIISMTPPESPFVPDDSLPTYPSSVPVPYALEVPKGWFEARGIRVGASVKF
ncbi:MAG: DUF192 domain-containing protein [Chloroherpetonaceae bacterium]|nr:DUF192 domain-containing protein [Chloroherpetonaceae bacterium]